MARKKEFDMGQLTEGNGLKADNPFEGFSSDISGMDIFGDDIPKGTAALKKAKEIAIEKLHPSPRNPYNVIKESDEMKELIASISKEGVLNPLVVRPKEEGGYEIISGHRRRCAAEAAGLKELPCFVRNLTDEEADRIMVDLNLNRENILPSEKARAVALKYEAIKRTAGRKKAGDTSQEHDSGKIIAEEMGMSERTIRNYVRLTSLAKPLSDAVDKQSLAQQSAIQLSYLPQELQEKIYDIARKGGVSLNEGLARGIKEALQKDAKASEEKIENLLGLGEKPEKKETSYKPVFRMPAKTRKKYFASGMSDEEVDAVIEKLLEEWSKGN